MPEKHFKQKNMKQFMSFIQVAFDENENIAGLTLTIPRESMKNDRLSKQVKYLLENSRVVNRETRSDSYVIKVQVSGQIGLDLDNTS